MSDEEKNAGSAGTATAAVPTEQPSLDEHTTEPNAPEPVKTAAHQAATGKWEMPKPKFQQTSGYLPQGYLQKMEEAAAEGSAGSEDTTQEQAPIDSSPPKLEGAVPPGVPAVEPQPDLAEQLIPDEPVAQSTNVQAQAKSGPSLPLIVFGLIGIVIFVVAFLAAVYFLFLAKPSGGTNF